MGFFQRSTSSRQQRGREGQARARAWLEGHLFSIVRECWAGLRPLGGGEIDILARSKTGELWIIEVKCTRSWAPFLPLLSARQRARLYRARCGVANEWRGAPVRVALLWVESSSAKIEFIENP